MVYLLSSGTYLSAVSPVAYEFSYDALGGLVSMFAEDKTDGALGELIFERRPVLSFDIILGLLGSSYKFSIEGFTAGVH